MAYPPQFKENKKYDMSFFLTFPVPLSYLTKLKNRISLKRENEIQMLF